MKIVVIDGQGGRMGASIIEQLKKEYHSGQVYGIGTNSIATTTMVKAGADFGATGENPVIVACRDADVIVGPIGIVVADSLFGEISPKMAVAIGQSKAYKVLLPFNKCNVAIAGTQHRSSKELINEAVEQIISCCKEEDR